jgi:hypothetical protein
VAGGGKEADRTGEKEVRLRISGPRVYSRKYLFER